MFAAIVQTGGCKVLTAQDGAEAIEKASQCEPDLIFMDLRMPGMDGFEATRRILSPPGMAAIPIVAVSAHHERDVVERARAAGCVEYLRKPVEPEMLQQMIEKYVGRWHDGHDDCPESLRNSDTITFENASRHSSQLLMCSVSASVNRSSGLATTCRKRSFGICSPSRLINHPAR